jgi:hypothetical protein
MAQANSKEILFTELQTTIINRKPVAADSAMLCLQVETTSSQREITKIGFLFNLDHLCTDGIGICIIAGLFLRLFAQRLSSGSHEEEVDLKWQDSASKLSPPWISIMNDKQKTSGLDFDVAVARQFQFLHESVSSANSSIVDYLSTI